MAGLAQIWEDGARLHIGALCTHTQIAADPLVHRYCAVLAKACAEVGSPQVRNRGTLGGNIANASPAADSLPALAALHATVVHKTTEDTCETAIGDFVTGPYRIGVSPQALITEIVVDKLPEGSRQCFSKLGRRNALAISRLTVAGAAWKDEAGRVAGLRLALGSVFPRPMVFEQLHEGVVGAAADWDKIRMLAGKLSEQIPKIAGVRASTRYKQPVSRGMLERVLSEVLEVN